jgi:hypothetical protein
LAAAEASRDEVKETLATFRAAYAKNPALAIWDAKFMETLETLAKNDAELQPLIKKVQDGMEASAGDGTTRGGAPVPTAAEKPTDTSVVGDNATLKTLVEGQARTTIKEALVGIKPAFVKILADHIVNTSEKLEGLTTADVVAAARAFVADKGLDKADMIEVNKEKPKADADSEGGSDKPNTGGSGRAASKSAGGEGGGDNEKGPQKPKDLVEWHEAHNRRLSAELDTEA